jgi:CheY-like chemotaxis protein
MAAIQRHEPPGVILLAAEDRKTQRTVQRVLSATLHRVEAVDTVAQARKILAEEPPALLVLDYQLMSATSAQALIQQAAEAGTLASLVLMNGQNPGALPGLLGLGSVTNLLANPMPLMAEELTVTALKLLRGDIFGLEKYMSWGVEARTYELDHTDQRTEVVDDLARAIRELGLGPRVASMARLTADELLSNAIYNAPVDSNGVHYRAGEQRDASRLIELRERPRLRYSCDARYLAVEVSDNFGSLRSSTILQHLVKATNRSGIDRIDFDAPGAGMGIALAYSCSTHLIFNLEPSERTEVIGLFDVRFKPAERGNGISSFNVFVRGGGENE